MTSLTNWPHKAIRGPFGYSRRPPARPEPGAVFMSPPKYVDLLVLAVALAVFPARRAAPARLRGRRRCLARPARDPDARGAAAPGRSSRAGNRQRAMGIVAATTLGRVWLMATAVLLVGLAEREAGLAAAVLVLVLFTVSFAAQGFAHLFGVSPRGRESHERRDAAAEAPAKSGLSTKTKVFIGLGVYLGDRDPDGADLRQLRQKRTTSSPRTSSSSNRGSRSTSPAST